jgi:trimethylamine---corrinoid protein Co-methyltransferase
MTRRANELWKRQLEQYQEPPLDPAVDEALLEYIKRRKDSFPDSNV